MQASQGSIHYRFFPFCAFYYATVAALSAGRKSIA